MATATSHPLIRHIRRLAGAQPAADLPDAHLLARFAADRDEAAFAVLVKRHGSLVLGVCRRVLGDWHAAEDCFQVAFAVLAQKAGDLRQPERLGPWLYGVAYRTALKARTRAARRGACERKAAAAPAVEPPDDMTWRDLRPVLDEAVAGLPEKYRAAFVMHYLEGATVDEVAHRLDWPRGTVATRLARARALLRKNLVRRGVTVPGVALAAALAANAGVACMPAALLVSTARAAVVAVRQALTGGTGVAMTSDPTLEGAKFMMTAKVKVAALLLVGLGVAGGGAALCGSGTPGMERGGKLGVAANPTAPAAAPEGDLILFLDGSTHFFRNEYRAAAGVFNRLGKRHPDSRLAPKAAALAVLARQLAEGGAADRDRASAEGRAHIRTALGDPPTLVTKGPDGAGRRAEGLRERQAQRDFGAAEFYRRTGHPGSACFYYELVSRHYPATSFAVKAAERLRELRKQTGAVPQAKGEAPARVGRVIINGNGQTPDALILYQLALYPGQVLTYPALSAAERNLAALHQVKAAVSVEDADAPGTFKDVLVQVEEQSVRGEGRPLRDGDGRDAPVLPPLAPGERPGCHDQPDRATILRALPRLPESIPGVCEVSRADVEVAVERLVDWIDPPRFYPVVGVAQVHHCRYKCLASYTETAEASWPFRFRCQRRRSDVVYIDRDHFHLVSAGAPGRTPTPRKTEAPGTGTSPAAASPTGDR